jgi:hypothetical protein
VDKKYNVLANWWTANPHTNFPNGDGHYYFHCPFEQVESHRGCYLGASNDANLQGTLCVRADDKTPFAAANERYELVAPGVIRDNASGMNWSTSFVKYDQLGSWNAVFQYCNGLAKGIVNGSTVSWRVPTWSQLIGEIDPGKKPFCDPEICPDASAGGAYSLMGLNYQNHHTLSDLQNDVAKTVQPSWLTPINNNANSTSGPLLVRCVSK